MSNSGRMCRICVKEKAPLVSILENNPLNLQEKLLKLLKIKVSEESLLPKQLCLECLSKLNQFNEFYVQTHENQVILQVIFGEKFETINEYKDIKTAIKCEQKSTQTDIMKEATQPSETYILIENISSENQSNNFIEETIFEGDETSQDTKMEIEQQFTIIEEEIKESKPFIRETNSDVKSRRKFDRFDCYLCQKQLTGNFQFLKHFATDHPKDEIRYQCYLCQNFVKKYRSYTRHIESHTEKRFECDICNLKFSQKITLITHLSSHSNVKKYECKDCSLSFKQNSSLFKHRKQKHSSEVPSCQECNRTFVNKETYQQHLKSKHNQQMKDISCTECDKKFASKSALSYHRLSNHSKINEQLKCENCMDEFKNRIILARHKKKCTKNT
ncbi:hypothetical protein PVAND_013004 [Polypedilum vanderplanki]|uniref:Zinc finger protein n=1 Tax=Polypedilum vanderplanki TaxID=319348 RepID=A0A9J6CQ50_POLVA|nr:hypothetical protein PVAND_013004 [Polypedilum vanderplanki]